MLVPQTHAGPYGGAIDGTCVQSRAQKGEMRDARYTHYHTHISRHMTKPTQSHMRHAEVQIILCRQSG